MAITITFAQGSKTLLMQFLARIMVAKWPSVSSGPVLSVSGHEIGICRPMMPASRRKTCFSTTHTYLRRLTASLTLNRGENCWKRLTELTVDMRLSILSALNGRTALIAARFWAQPFPGGEGEQRY